MILELEELEIGNNLIESHLFGVPEWGAIIHLPMQLIKSVLDSRVTFILSLERFRNEQRSKFQKRESSTVG